MGAFINFFSESGRERDRGRETLFSFYSFSAAEGEQQQEAGNPSAAF